MNQTEKVRRDLETVIESLRHDFRARSALQLTPEERAGIDTHIQWFLARWEELKKELG